ncbi:hypothetical protein AGLY_003012 [Aphis glycines]|uniref:Uncharacterized protein n=1 Tax=Aphis glycines TaxID=307491 RepID=A0A6G0U1W1_APHGL|nr:hypothetical protein AGLY_003012 [Aphis glycines]
MANSRSSENILKINILLLENVSLIPSDHSLKSLRTIEDTIIENHSGRKKSTMFCTPQTATIDGCKIIMLKHIRRVTIKINSNMIDFEIVRDRPVVWPSLRGQVPYPSPLIGAHVITVIECDNNNNDKSFSYGIYLRNECLRDRSELVLAQGKNLDCGLENKKIMIKKKIPTLNKIITYEELCIKFSIMNTKNFMIFQLQNYLQIFAFSTDFILLTLTFGENFKSRTVLTSSSTINNGNVLQFASNVLLRNAKQKAYCSDIVVVQR